MIRRIMLFRWMRSTLRFLITIALLYILFRMTDPAEILSALQKANIWYILAALVMLLPNLGFQFLKWQYLLVKTGRRFPLSDVLASFLFGLTLGSFTPGQIGEFGGRALKLRAEEPGIIVGLTMFDKFQVFAIMILGGVFSLAILLRMNASVVIASTSAAIVLALLVLFRPAFLRTFLNTMGISRLKYRWAGHILEALSLISVRDAAITATLTLLFYTIVYLQLLFLFRAFSPIDPLQVFLGYSAVMLIKSLLPISIGDLGTREIGLVYFMGIQGIAKSVSFDASILLFTMNILLPAISGLIFLPDKVSPSHSLTDD